LEAISEHLKNAYKEYDFVKGEAKKIRNTALENLAIALAEKGNSTQSKCWRISDAVRPKGLLLEK
jgi:hypothetical protein